MRMKITTNIRKKIKEILDWRTYNETGMRKINGGYGEVSKLKIRIDEDNKQFLIDGIANYGVQDMGGGDHHNTEHTFSEIVVKFDEVLFDML